LPIIQHLIAAYKLWHEFLPHLTKYARHTLGVKIDALFVDTIEIIFVATYLGKEQKMLALQQANAKFDTLKFFLQILWEIKAIDNKKYAVLSERLGEIGRMLGGWMRQTSARN
jgi:hypothetical protein